MNRKGFWILIITFHSLFFFKQVFFGNSMLQDSREYLYAADNLVQENTLYAWNLNDSFNPSFLTKRPVLYPAILVTAKAPAMGSDKTFFSLLYLLQNLASFLSIWLVLKIAERFARKISYTHAILFMLFSVSQAIYANMVMSEIWLQLCLVAVVYILLLKPLDTRHVLYISLLLVAGMSLKPVLMFTAFCFPLYYLFRTYKRIVVSQLALTLLPLCFYFSICKINKERTGYFHYSSISTINLLHYNTFSVLYYHYGQHNADSIIDQMRGNAKLHGNGDYPAQQAYLRKASAEKINEHLGTYIWLHARGVIFCLLDPGRFDFTQFFNLPHEKNLIYQTNEKNALKNVIRSFMNPLGILLGVLLLFNIFKIYVVLRFFFSKSLSLTLRLTILFFPLYILFFTGPIGTSRFYMPFIPLVLLMMMLCFGKKKTGEA